MENRKTGRPAGSGLKMTEELRLKYCTHIEGGKTGPEAAQLVGVDYRTVKRTAKLDPTFADAIAAAQEVACAPIVNKLREMALGGHFDSIRLWLQTYGGPQHQPPAKRTELEVKGGIALETGATVTDRIRELMERMSERQAELAEVIDVEVVSPPALTTPDTEAVDTSTS